MEQIFCPKCNNEMTEHAAFCNQCGTKLLHTESPSEEDEPPSGDGFGQCGHRGHIIQAQRVNARFCAGCGQDLHHALAS